MATTNSEQVERYDPKCSDCKRWLDECICMGYIVLTGQVPVREAPAVQPPPARERPER